jgi:hypothetical protein
MSETPPIRAGSSSNDAACGCHYDIQGREPDEDRLDLDLGRLESYATRLSFTRGDERRAIARMAAFGQNREIHGNLEA